MCNIKLHSIRLSLNFTFMSRKKRYIKLNSEQKVALELGYKKGNSHDYRSRCRCILLSSEQWSVNQLMEFFDVSRRSVYSWFNRYETEGIEGLKIRSGRGRKRKLDIDNSEHVATVKSELAKENRSIKRLRQELESKYNTTISRRTLHSFLKVLVTDTDASDSVSNPNRTRGRWVKK